MSRDSGKKQAFRVIINRNTGKSVLRRGTRQDPQMDDMWGMNVPVDEWTSVIRQTYPKSVGRVPTLGSKVAAILQRCIHK